MGKVKLTNKGAQRLGRPDLEGKEVEAEVDWWDGGAREIHFQGKKLTGALTFRGKDPEVQLIQK